MCEKNLYKKLDANLSEIEKMNGRLFLIKDNIKMKMKLLDSRVINGIYIDRSKNFTSPYYDVEETPDKVNYRKKNPSKVDFQQLLKERKP